MDKAPEPQQQPVYQQPYYQQPYPQPYPYYYPPPPRKKEDRTILILVVVLIIVFVVLPIVLSAVLYWWVIGLAPETDYYDVPTGVWGSKTVLSSTSVNVEFGKVSGDPRPMDLEIMLVRDGTFQGRYEFSTNNDGALVFMRGSDIADIGYSDLADNQRVNTGDFLILTSLSPSSDYTLRMIWGPTGDQITSTTFSTPG
jgi:hypothetical protein